MTRNGEAGAGLFWHYKRGISLIWPEIKWHKWNELSLDSFLKYRIIGEMGPASSGKTHDWSIMVLFDYYCFPHKTTVLVSSTTLESLEMRAWGEIKKHHRIARRKYNWLPGNLIEGKRRIVTDSRDEAIEGRDFRNGLVAVACKRGQEYQGLAEYVGIKNDRVRLMADELPFMPPSFVDSISNLNKNLDFKCGGIGNPKDITDAHGMICCPADDIGGWDSGIDQTPKTKTWRIRFDHGICIQKPGSDSPNYDGNLGIPLITKKDIDSDIAFYGKDSLQYTMMDEGRMPRGQSQRRILTRNFCMRHLAMEEANWANTERTKIGFLDAAYKGMGGDRTVFGWLEFGTESEETTASSMAQSIISQQKGVVSRRQIMCLMDTMVVPIVDDKTVDAEDQIALFVKEHCEDLGIDPTNFFFDSTGRGSLTGAFGRLWSPMINPVEFGGVPSERNVSAEIDIPCNKYYDRMVSELWYTARHVVESNQFRGMTEEMLNEGCRREFTMIGAKTSVEPKDKMKLKTGRSPDLFDALVAGIEGARRRGFIIEKGSAHRASQNNTWKRELRERAKNLVASKELSFK